MDDKLVNRVLAGDLNDLPSVSSRVVRIFTSSTFTDTTEERNLLIEKVYPKLKDYCRNKYGYEFQVVDMRWGVRDEATDDHSTTNLCLQEVNNCQKLSIGPNFVMFLGQRHGFKSFPSEIDAEEFETLLTNFDSKSDPTTDWIKQWFSFNENTIPPQFVLKSISSHFPDFLSEDQTKRKTARDQWNAIHQKLYKALRSACLKCVSDGRLSGEHLKRYYMSVTELEIEEGLFLSPADPNDKCLCFVRIISDIEKNIDHPKAWRYIDMTNSLVDEDSKQQLASLRDARIVEKLATENVYKSSVNWHLPKGGIDPEEHKDYLKEFSDVFYAAVVKLIDKGAKAHEALASNELLMEVLQHSKMAESRVSVFHGREDVINNVSKLIATNSRNPIVIHGLSGCGKTSIMAKSASMVEKWVQGKNPVVILRMLGTSAKSSDITQTLQSVCHQIAVNYNVESFEHPTDHSDTLREFKNLLSSATAEKPLFIFLDSLDQLSSANGAYSLGWLPRELPENVHMILSTLPSLYGILQNLESKLPTESFIQVKPMGQDLCKDIIKSWLQSSRRKLTANQHMIVSKAFKMCSLPLYVKLVFEQVSHWRSEDPETETVLFYTVPAVINDLFKRLELKHGRVFIFYALGYMTASQSGISESEWEDLLSLNDIVLDDVFQYHIPPVRRIPQILIVRLLADISHYVVTRKADNTRVIYWYHRQFIETAQSRFLYHKWKRTIHIDMAIYYTGKYHGLSKDFCYTVYQMKKLGLVDICGCADRLVPAQPLVFEGTDSNGKPRYNLRKINNLPYHFMEAEDRENMKKYLFDLDFLQAKLRGSGIQSILNELLSASKKTINKTSGKDQIKTVIDKPVSDLRNALSVARASLNKNPDSLPIEIAGRLLHLVKDDKDIKQLVEQCFKKLALLPVTVCYPTPGGALVQTLEHKNLPIAGMEKYLFVTNNGQKLLALSEKNEIIIWDLESGDVEREVALLDGKQTTTKLNFMKKSADGQSLIIADALQRDGNPIAIYNIKNDDLTCVVQLDKVYKSVGFVDNFNIDATKEYIVINIKDKEGDIFDMKGALIHHFDQKVTVMLLTLTGQTIMFLPKEKAEITFFSLRKLSFWSNSLQISDIITEEFIIMSKKSSRILVGYKSLYKVDIIELNEDEETTKITNCVNVYNKNSPVSSMQLSEDEKYLFILAEMEVLIWDFKNSRWDRKVVIPEEARSQYNVRTFKCILSCGNNTLAMIHDEKLLVFNGFYREYIGNIHASKTPITELVGASYSKVLTANRTNRFISVWDVDNIEMDVYHPLSMPTSVRYLNADRTGRYLAVRGYEAKDIRVLDTKTGMFASQLQTEISSMAPSITEDGVFVVLQEYNSESDAITVCLAETGRVVSSIPVSMLSFKVAALGSPPQEPQDKYLIATHSETSPTEDIRTQVWDLKTGSHILDVQATTGGLSKMEFARNNRYLVTLQQYPQLYEGRQCTIHVYDLDSDGCEIFKEEGYLKDMLFIIPETNNILTVKTATVSGKEAFETNADETVVMDIQTKEIISRSKITPTHLLHFSNDGCRAIDSTLKVFDIENGCLVQDFYEVYEKGNQPIKYRARITRSGEFAVWVSEKDCVIRVADVSSGTMIAEAYTHALPQSLEISDDNILAVGCDDGRIMLLQIWPAYKQGREQVLETRTIDFSGNHGLKAEVQRQPQSTSAEVKRQPRGTRPKVTRQPQSTCCQLL